jgi:hypothetical protein
MEESPAIEVIVFFTTSDTRISRTATRRIAHNTIGTTNRVVEVHQ